MRVRIKSKYRDKDGKRRKASYHRMLATVPIHGTRGQLFWAYEHPQTRVCKAKDVIETDTGTLVVEINVHDRSYFRAGLVAVDTDGVHGVIDWDAVAHRGIRDNVHTIFVNGRELEFLI